MPEVASPPIGFNSDCLGYATLVAGGTKAQLCSWPICTLCARRLDRRSRASAAARTHKDERTGAARRNRIVPT